MIGQTTAVAASVLVASEDIGAAASKASKAESLLGKVGTFSKYIAISSAENVKNILTLPGRTIGNLGSKVADLRAVLSEGKGGIGDFRKSVVVSSAKNAKSLITLPGRTLKNLKNAAAFVNGKLIPASGEAVGNLGKVLKNTGTDLKGLSHQEEVVIAGVGQASAGPNIEFSKVVENFKNGIGEVKDNFVKAVKSGDARITITNMDQANEWGSQYYDNWLKSLNDSERNAIRQYTGNDYKKINNYLRGVNDSLDGVDPQVIEDIKSGLKKASVPHDMKVYRGTDLNPLRNLIDVGKDGSLDFSSLVGKTFKDDGFMSTALVKESSFDYMNVSWEINVPKGTEAAYVSKISYFPDEAELLLNAGQEMIIKEATVGSDGKLHIILDLNLKR
ncbi:ADP-ribosyltransferase [Clostridium felsineum]|uniref:ADP-ribosyltransferase n=1 Tax=Clostridium felsineum TaxID=36839 RepID=UPI00098CDA38